MSHDVVLPRNQPPRFPDICVGCGCKSPDGLATISSVGFSGAPSGLDMAPLVLGENPGTPIGSNVTDKLQAPACSRCARAIERRHLWKKVALYGGGLAGLAWFAVALFGLGLFWAALAGLAAGLAGPVAWDLADPPLFTAWPNRGMIAYEFRSSASAMAFAEANGGKVA